VYKECRLGLECVEKLRTMSANWNNEEAFPRGIKGGGSKRATPAPPDQYPTFSPVYPDVFFSGSLIRGKRTVHAARFDISLVKQSMRLNNDGDTSCEEHERNGDLDIVREGL